MMPDFPYDNIFGAGITAIICCLDKIFALHFFILRIAELIGDCSKFGKKDEGNDESAREWFSFSKLMRSS